MIFILQRDSNQLKITQFGPVGGYSDLAVKSGVHVPENQTRAP